MHLAFSRNPIHQYLSIERTVSYVLQSFNPVPGTLRKRISAFRGMQPGNTSNLLLPNDGDNTAVPECRVQTWKEVEHIVKRAVITWGKHGWEKVGDAIHQQLTKVGTFGFLISEMDGVMDMNHNTNTELVDIHFIDPS
ncbi:hypothetical protein TNCV_590491 [Trichonephila clavipes]|nr:hypothetical protein TNCV_590491 [Trichonephila clavipes]